MIPNEPIALDLAPFALWKPNHASFHGGHGVQ